jgi:hypothetical protein
MKAFYSRPLVPSPSLHPRIPGYTLAPQLTRHHCYSHRAGHHWSPPRNRSSLWESEVTKKTCYHTEAQETHVHITYLSHVHINRSVCPKRPHRHSLPPSAPSFTNSSELQGLQWINCMGSALSHISLVPAVVMKSGFTRALIRPNGQKGMFLCVHWGGVGVGI